MIKEYFKTIKIPSYNKQTEDYSYIKDLLLIEKINIPTEILSKKTIVLPFPKKTILIKQEPKSIEIKTLNTFKLKQLFPYSYLSIKKSLQDKPNSTIIETGKKKIPVNPDWFITHKKYQNYRVLCSNEYFTAFLPLQPKTPNPYQ